MLARTRTHEVQATLQAPSDGEDLMADYRSTGLSLKNHPLKLLRVQLAAFRVQPASVLNGYRPGQLARASGLVTHRQRPETAKGVIFVTLEDETGAVNVIVWPQVAQTQRKPLLASTLLTVYGVWQREGEVRHLIARKLVDHSHLLSGLVAGYGLSGAASDRPGFGWFFGGDASINSFAMSAVGQRDLVRDGVFRFFAKYQRADGKITHEISQGAGKIDWFGAYPYAFYHGDTTPFWMIRLPPGHSSALERSTIVYSDKVGPVSSIPIGSMSTAQYVCPCCSLGHHSAAPQARAASTWPILSILK
jgi:hypothetical protein